MIARNLRDHLRHLQHATTLLPKKIPMSAPMKKWTEESEEMNLEDKVNLRDDLHP
jgi:hypothetical protein